MATFCWERRGCEGEQNNFDHCPHYELNGKCPIDCAFAECQRPTYKQVTGLDLLLDPYIDRDACIKEYCRTCEFYLTHGPKIAGYEEEQAKQEV